MSASLQATTLQTRPLHPEIGVEVLGLDLSRPLGAGTIAELKRLWAQHLVLLFRGQSLSEEQQVAFSELFGSLERAPEGKWSSSRNPAVLRVANTTETGNKVDPEHMFQRYFATLAALWHTDSSHRAIPAYGSMLHALEIPPSGGNTCFANTIAAYDVLPAERKRLLEGRHMVHYYGFSRLFEPTLPPISADDLRAFAPVTHPLVRTLPDGRRCLFLSANVAWYVGGMPIEQGEALHRELIDWATQDQFVYSHEWRVGDLLLWDNRPTMHRVLPYDKSYRRVLQRTSVAGTEVPV